MKPKEKTNLYRLSEKGANKVIKTWFSPNVLKGANICTCMEELSQADKNKLREILTFQILNVSEKRTVRGKIVVNVKCASHPDQWCWHLHMEDLEEYTDNTSYEIKWV